MVLRWFQRVAFGHGRRRTEGRQCIEDVLMRQRNLERQLGRARDPRGLVFEDLCVRAGVGDSGSFGPTDRPSCGHTLQCWASLFLSAPQISRSRLYQLIAGGSVVQTFNNANVVLHVVRHRLELMSTKRLPRFVLAWARGYCQTAAVASQRLLRATLMVEERASLLPRVLFCSMSWVTVPRASSTAEEDEACAWEDAVFDHEFAIVKRRCAESGDLQFQLVQGYSASGESDGFGLVGWQQSSHRFASLEGFGKCEMLAWLDHCAVFAHATADFDTANFRSAFGVSGNRADADGDAGSLGARIAHDLE